MHLGFGQIDISVLNSDVNVLAWNRDGRTHADDLQFERIANDDKSRFERRATNQTGRALDDVADSHSQFESFDRAFKSCDNGVRKYASAFLEVLCAVIVRVID